MCNVDFEPSKFPTKFPATFSRKMIFFCNPCPDCLHSPIRFSQRRTIDLNDATHSATHNLTFYRPSFCCLSFNIFIGLRPARRIKTICLQVFLSPELPLWTFQRSRCKLKYSNHVIFPLDDQGVILFDQIWISRDEYIPTNVSLSQTNGRVDDRGTDCVRVEYMIYA